MNGTSCRYVFYPAPPLASPCQVAPYKAGNPLRRLVRQGVPLSPATRVPSHDAIHQPIINLLIAVRSSFCIRTSPPLLSDVFRIRCTAKLPS